MVRTIAPKRPFQANINIKARLQRKSHRPWVPVLQEDERGAPPTPWLFPVMGARRLGDSAGAAGLLLRWFLALDLVHHVEARRWNDPFANQISSLLLLAWGIRKT